MKRFALLSTAILFLMVIAMPTVAQDAPKSAPMQMYHTVIVKKGVNWQSQHTQAGADVRVEIIENIKKAAKKGLVITAGLVNDETDAEFILILNIKNKYEALQLMEKAKNIKNGMFQVEIYSMFAPKGLTSPGK